MAIFPRVLGVILPHRVHSLEVTEMTQVELLLLQIETSYYRCLISMFQERIAEHFTSKNWYVMQIDYTQALRHTNTVRKVEKQ